MEAVLDAISAFWDYLASVDRVALAIAIGLTCVNVIVGFAAILLTLRTLRFRRVSDPDAATDTS